MMMRIDETWTDDFVGAVNDLCLSGSFDAVFYLRDNISFDQQVCFQRLRMAIITVDEKCSSLEKD